MASRFKFKIPIALLTRLISMTVISVFAVMVMIAVNLKGRNIEQDLDSENSDQEPATVVVLDVISQSVEITQKYSGTIRPFEEFKVSFKSVGSVSSIGLNQQEKPLDDGDLVQQNQVLAKLDTTVLAADRAELQAIKKFAEVQFNEAERLSKEQDDLVSSQELETKRRELNVAESKLKKLQTLIDDASLICPVDGKISRRLINPGESSGPTSIAFEIIQVDQVKLVVGVPESNVHRLLLQPDLNQIARVKLIGKDRIPGVQKPIEGKVIRVSETALDTSGLFEVEILLDNRERLMRPGMIAITRIVVENKTAYKIPLESVFFRENETFMFVAIPDSDEEGNQESNRWIAKKIVLPKGTHEIQGKELIVTELPETHRKIIVKGQRRLVDGSQIQFSDATGTSKP